jgi:ATP-dependent exoDNAse (exonuclease V) beta subunit
MLSQQQEKEQDAVALPKKRISYSELKIWNDCSFRHKLTYLDNLSNFKGNEHTAFGKAVHSVCEKLVIDEGINTNLEFKKAFRNEIKTLDANNTKLDKSLVVNMLSQTENIFDKILPNLKKYFDNYTIFSIEEMLYESIDEFKTDYKFKGFIDIVLKTNDGKYHIIDWKTCSWGWKSQKKSEAMTVYQLSLYKHFFSKKHNIPLDNIETHFALLKRTAKKNNVEIFRVSNKSKRISNALGVLEKAIFNIKSKNYVKNKLSCKYCEFKNTAHCP